MSQLASVTDSGEPSAVRFRKTLRFPINVNSKIMIVDDIYILVGSANINQRSMAGTRDTEMSVGCWQKDFTEKNPHGDVHIFRMSLWAEHFRFTCTDFHFPGSEECLNKVKNLAAYNWQIYCQMKHGVTPGQVLCYPLKIEQDGSIGTLDGMTSFPDFGPIAYIMGAKSSYIPQTATT